jgi:trans-2,3-dihydro-3-hydroxyanthranilate isomerase
MPSLKFAVYDVFTDTRFQGNPLAVVFDADALGDSAMQAIAREFNLSETIFVRRPADQRHAASVRIFTPGAELPFAGHPIVGCSIALAEARAMKGDCILVLEAKIAPVRCAVTTGNGGFAEFDAPKLAEELGLGADDAAMAAALGLAPGDIGFDRHIPTLYSAGVPYAFAPVASLAALARASARAVDEEAIGAPSVFLYARADASDAHAFRARMFAPKFGITEDPATGSAAAAFAGVAARFEGLGEGWTNLPILQGVEMGRPSLIGLEIQMTEGKLSGVRISGKAVKVSEGTLFA